MRSLAKIFQWNTVVFIQKRSNQNQFPRNIYVLWIKSPSFYLEITQVTKISGLLIFVSTECRKLRKTFCSSNFLFFPLFLTYVSKWGFSSRIRISKDSFCRRLYVLVLFLGWWGIWKVVKIENIWSVMI